MVEEDGVKIGSVIRIMLLLSVFGLILASTVFEARLHTRFPWFTGEGAMTASVLSVGMIYAIIERQILVGIMTIIATLCMPYMFVFFREYWNWASQGDPLLYWISKILHWAQTFIS